MFFPSEECPSSWHTAPWARPALRGERGRLQVDSLLALRNWIRAEKSTILFLLNGVCEILLVLEPWMM